MSGPFRVIVLLTLLNVVLRPVNRGMGCEDKPIFAWIVRDAKRDFQLLVLPPRAP
jgi:hypothetical protein